MSAGQTQSRCFSVAVNDTEGGYECPDDVAFRIEEQDLSSYQRAADFYQQRGHNRFVELENLKEFIGTADLYITPYLHDAQITSGTLACAFGAGKAVVPTPYWHAAELLAEEA
jgi:hypothetical protein